jgi:hypothetical protein
LAAEGDESWTDFVSNDVPLVFLCTGSVFVAHAVFDIILSQIEEVFVGSCFSGESNDAGAPFSMFKGVNEDGVVSGITVAGVLVVKDLGA